MLTAAASATDAVFHKIMFGSGNITLMISNEKMNDILKIINSLRGILYIYGWCTSFKTLYFFFKTLMTLL